MNAFAARILIVLALVASIIGTVWWSRHQLRVERETSASLRRDVSALEGEKAVLQQSITDRDAQRQRDADNQAAAQRDAITAQEAQNRERQTADRTIAALHADQLRIRPGLGCPAAAPATAAGAAGTPGQTAPAGLQATDAEFLVRLAADADAVAIERNEAVAGWQRCIAVSDGVAP